MLQAIAQTMVVVGLQERALAARRRTPQTLVRLFEYMLWPLRLTALPLPSSFSQQPSDFIRPALNTVPPLRPTTPPPCLSIALQTGQLFRLRSWRIP